MALRESLTSLKLSRLFARQSIIASGIRQRVSSSTQSKDRQAPEDEFHLNYMDGDRKGVVVFSLRRFHRRNAMGTNLMHMFLDGMSRVKFDNSVRCIVLRSEVPGVFCAGADLKERAEMTNDQVASFVKMLRFSMSELAAMPMPTIAAIDGTAVGGGLEWALACDLRVASTTAKMGLIETSRGLLPGAGGTQRLPRTIGVARAKELIFTSRVIDGVEAERLGVINKVVAQNSEGNAAFQAALELAEEILPQGPIALRMAKMAINHGSEVDINSGMKYEEAYYAQVIPTKDRIEGMRAFMEKRKPDFRGH